MNVKYFSTFSGIGGFELGIGARGECVGFSEVDRYATTIYQRHFPNHHNYGDITKIDAGDLPDFELFVGGFPCQAFSIAGKRGGFSDTRGTLFFEIARIVREKQPRFLLLENVKGLLSHDNGSTFFTIIATLDELGYDLQWQVLNSKNHGVPQNRERVFIVGNFRGTPRPEVFPFREEVGLVAESKQSTEVQIASTLAGAGGHIANGEYKGMNLVQINNPVHSNDRVYGADGISPTLNTMQGGLRQPFVRVTEDGFHLARQDAKKSSIQGTHVTFPEGKADAQIRRLTPVECERLQGFPDGWTENGLSSIMEVCVNINPAIEKRLLQLDTVSNITSDGSGMVIPISQNESKEPVNIVLHELLLEGGAISTINHGNAIATLFNRRGTLLNATQLKESLILEKTVEKSTYKLWKVSLVGHYEKEKLSTILTWINETMQSITSISARTDESIIGVIILLNSQELNYSNGESLCLRMGNIEPISDTQRYKTLGNAVTVNVIRDIIDRLLI